MKSVHTLSLVLLLQSPVLHSQAPAVCRPGFSNYSLTDFNTSFCINNAFTVNYRDKETISFLNQDKSMRMTAKIFFLYGNSARMFFYKEATNTMDQFNATGNWDLKFVDGTDGKEEFDNVPEGFRRYKTIYKYKSGINGMMYLMIFDYLLKEPGNNNFSMSGFYVWNFASEETTILAAVLNTSETFKTFMVIPPHPEATPPARPVKPNEYYWSQSGLFLPIQSNWNIRKDSSNRNVLMINWKSGDFTASSSLDISEMHTTQPVINAAKAIQDAVTEKTMTGKTKDIVFKSSSVATGTDVYILQTTYKVNNKVYIYLSYTIKNLVSAKIFGGWFRAPNVPTGITTVAAIRNCLLNTKVH